eukprot:jgi/Botrbrau1/3847/Bobra.0183s0072.1
MHSRLLLTFAVRRVTCQGGVRVCAAKPLVPTISSLMRVSSIPTSRMESRRVRSADSLSSASRLVLKLQPPTELWGAVNAVSAALHTPGRENYSTDGKRPEVQASVREAAEALREALDFRPVLSTPEAVGCLAVAAAACMLVYSVTAPAMLSVQYSISMGLLFATCLTIARSFLLERHYRDKLKAEVELKDLDSRFRNVDGINVHYKVEQANRAVGDGRAKPLAVAAYHGFGANTGSWEYVYKPLAQRLQAQVTHSDMPGFGLTQRPVRMRYYTLQINGHFGREIMDAELEAAGLIPPLPKGEQTPRGGGAIRGPDGEWVPRRPRHPAGVATRVLMGHSMGAACCAAEVIAHPEGVDALILVAPAVLALKFGRGEVAHMEHSGQSEQISFHSTPTSHAQKEVEAKGRSITLRAVIAVLTAAATLLARTVIWLMQPLLVLALRAAVRSRAFWERGIGSAWFAPAGLTADLIDAYRRPQLVRGWELGLVRFLMARVSGGRSLGQILRDAYNGKVQPLQAEQLASVVARYGIKVLIVHGEGDVLVPVSNSKRLAAMLPGARLVVYQKCGHTPQEEMPDKFVETVADFLETFHSAAAA